MSATVPWKLQKKSKHSSVFHFFRIIERCFSFLKLIISTNFSLAYFDSTQEKIYLVWRKHAKKMNFSFFPRINFQTIACNFILVFQRFTFIFRFWSTERTLNCVLFGCTQEKKLPPVTRLRVFSKHLFWHPFKHIEILNVSFSFFLTSEAHF